MGLIQTGLKAASMPHFNKFKLEWHMHENLQPQDSSDLQPTVVTFSCPLNQDIWLYVGVGSSLCYGFFLQIQVFSFPLDCFLKGRVSSEWFEFIFPFWSFFGAKNEILHNNSLIITTKWEWHQITCYITEYSKMQSIQQDMFKYRSSNKNILVIGMSSFSSIFSNNDQLIFHLYLYM